VTTPSSVPVNRAGQLAASTRFSTRSSVAATNRAYPHRRLRDHQSPEARQAQADHADKLRALEARGPRLDPLLNDETTVEGKMVRATQEPLTIDAILQIFRDFFPGEEPLILSNEPSDSSTPPNLDHGLVVMSTTNACHYLRITPSPFRPYSWDVIVPEGLKVTKVTFGALAGKSHVESSILDHPNWDILTARKRLMTLARGSTSLETSMAKGRGLSGALQVKSTVEHWALDPVSGDGLDAPQQGFLRSQILVEEGRFVSMVTAAKAMANNYLTTLGGLRKRHPGALLVRSGTPPSGSARSHQVNDQLGRDVHARQMSAAAHRLRSHLRPRSAESQIIANDQAMVEGEASFDALLESMDGGDSLRANTAGMVAGSWLVVTDPDTGLRRADYYEAQDLSNLVIGELGTFMEAVSLSGPFLMGGRKGFVAKIDGKPVLSTRHGSRRYAGTAKTPNLLYSTPHDRVEALANVTVMEDPRDPEEIIRMAANIERGAAIYVSDDGTHHASPHTVRWEEQRKPDDTGYTVDCDGESSFIAHQLRKMALMQIFQFLVHCALDEGQSVYEYLEDRTSYTREQLIGNSFAVMNELVYKGYTPRVEASMEMLREVINAVNAKAPELLQAKHVLLAALDHNFNPATTYLTLAQGRGNQAHANINLAEDGYSGNDASWVNATFAEAEALFLSEATDNEILNYLLGIRGFHFVIPTIGRIRHDRGVIRSSRTFQGLSLLEGGAANSDSDQNPNQDDQHNQS
jgi:hypothetical protein